MPQKLDTGIQDFIHPELMPEQLEPEASGFMDVVQAAKRQENDIYNAVELFRRQSFPKQKDFDLIKSLEARNLVDRGEEFVGVMSDAELDDRHARIVREEKDRETLSAAGWGGLAAQVASGAISPTIFIPLLRGATGVKSIAKGAFSVAAGAGAQEAVLMANQQTRTKGEVAFSLGASTILGGILGGVAHTLSKAEFDRMASDMVRLPGEEAISKPTPFTIEKGVGADVPVAALNDPGALSNGWGAKYLSPLSPVTRGLAQWNAPAYIKNMGGSPQLRKMTAGLSQSNLRTEKNVDFEAAVPGGNVEELKKQYSVDALAGKKAFENAFKEYSLGKETSGIGSYERAVIAARGSGKMNVEEFAKAVTVALWRGIPEDTNMFVAKAAKKIAQDVHNKLYKEAVEVGIFSGEEKLVGDAGYAMRDYNHNNIIARKPEFIQKIAAHYAGKLEKEFAEGVEKLKTRIGKDETLIEYMQLRGEEARALKEELEIELSELNAGTSASVLDSVTDIKLNKVGIADNNRLIAELRKSLNEGTPEEISAKLGQITKLEDWNRLHQEKIAKAEAMSPAEREAYLSKKKEIDRRLNALKKAQGLQEERLQKKLDKIEANEEAQIDTILRANKQLAKFEKFLDKTDDKTLDAEIEKLKGKFNEAGERLDKIDADMGRIEAEELNADPNALEIRAENISVRMDQLSAKIEQFESIDRAGIKAEVQQMMRDLAETHAQINAKRAARNEKLWKQIENMSPEARAARLEAVKAKAAKRAPEFMGRWQGRATDIDLAAGKADFTEHAKEIAERVTEKILGTDRRLAFSDIIQAERGPELARALDFPSDDFADFLETDIRKLVSTYVRTVGSDISIARVFGKSDMSDQFAALTEEQKMITDRIGADEKLTPEAKEKLLVKVDKFYSDGRKDLYTLLERAKGIRGVPKDPDSWGARAARAAADLNYLRYMGGVLISSVSDPARIVMKYGLTRTFRDGIMPMITNWKTIRMSQREAKHAGTALDAALHTRMYSLTDVFDDAYRGTMVERGLHYFATRLGTLGLFDQWNSAMKQITAGVTNTKALDAIAIVNGEKASAKEVRQAQAFLAKNNIDREIAETIWAQVTNGEGGGKVNGVWLPNTESWDVSDPMVAKARRAYRAMLTGEVDSTIITPGFERPSWVDANLLYRALAQFRSYGFSSTQKVVMAGLQEHDAAFVNGVMVSLGLGAFGYYLWAQSVGGDAYEEMINAPIEKWADEAITRSGVLGIFDEVQRTAQRVPGLREYASLSGTRSTRREGGDLVEGVLGPSFDLIDKAAGVIAGLDDPTKHTLHLARQMLPFQNLFYLRQLLDQIEQSAGLPERRTQ